jgi:hypothetical protein
VRRWKRGEWKRLKVGRLEDWKVERQKVWKFCGSLGGRGEEEEEEVERVESDRVTFSNRLSTYRGLLTTLTLTKLINLIISVPTEKCQKRSALPAQEPRPSPSGWFLFFLGCDE